MENLSLVELKALAYDALARIQENQNALSRINAEILKRSNEPQKPVEGN